MKIAVAVEHHPRRADLLDRLLPRLGGLDYAVVSDPEPDGKPSSWRCYRECLRLCAYGLEAWEYTHLLVVQDDTLPCDDFEAELYAAVEERPDSLVCLFASRQQAHVAMRMRQALDRGERWVHHPMGWVPSVALVWPVIQIPRFLDWRPGGLVREGQDLSEEEVRIGRWARRHCDVWHRVPSLVEHPDDVPSLFRKHSVKNRVAVCPPGSFPGVPQGYDPPAAARA